MSENQVVVEGVRVVWWAFVLGGLLGGLCKVLLDGQIVMPRVAYLETTGETIVVPGFLAPLFLGPVAAFLMAGAGAAVFEFQSSFDQRGFWGPFVGSIPAGIGATYTLAQITRSRLEDAASELFEQAQPVDNAVGDIAEAEPVRNGDG